MSRLRAVRARAAFGRRWSRSGPVAFAGEHRPDPRGRARAASKMERALASPRSERVVLANQARAGVSHHHPLHWPPPSPDGWRAKRRTRRRRRVLSLRRPTSRHAEQLTAARTSKRRYFQVSCDCAFRPASGAGITTCSRRLSLLIPLRTRRCRCCSTPCMREARANERKAETPLASPEKAAKVDPSRWGRPPALESRDGRIDAASRGCRARMERRLLRFRHPSILGPDAAGCGAMGIPSARASRSKAGAHPIGSAETATSDGHTAVGWTAAHSKIPCYDRLHNRSCSTPRSAQTHGRVPRKRPRKTVGSALRIGYADIDLAAMLRAQGRGRHRPVTSSRRCTRR